MGLKNNVTASVIDMNLVPVYKEYDITGNGVRITIIDDGIEFTHDDIKDNFVSITHLDPLTRNVCLIFTIRRYFRRMPTSATILIETFPVYYRVTKIREIVTELDAPVWLS